MSGPCFLTSQLCQSALHSVTYTALYADLDLCLGFFSGPKIQKITLQSRPALNLIKMLLVDGRRLAEGNISGSTSAQP